MHARKVAAVLQHECPNVLVLLRTAKDQGHGPAAVNRLIESAANRLPFIFKALSIHVNEDVDGAARSAERQWKIFKDIVAYKYVKRP
ncbi:MAG: hypothetical protein M1569_04030 [Candidatus Marsarchaeota archaeon]|nr:hypothetical protein [Candidatus Marsarchaeota archaeon]MCL5413541.1 hypothetical protein [Candidatus Marsarchaeota archaeon]